MVLAEELGISLYDKNFITEMAIKTGLSKEYIEQHEQKRNFLEGLNNGYYVGLDNSDELFLKEAEFVKEVANTESCVIVGRCADFLLKDKKNVLKVFIYSDMEHKVKRAIKYYHLEKENAEKEIKRINKLRANHYKHYTAQEWNDYKHYDLCLHSDAIGVEKVAQMICCIAKEKIML